MMCFSAIGKPALLAVICNFMLTLFLKDVMDS